MRLNSFPVTVTLGAGLITALAAVAQKPPAPKPTIAAAAPDAAPQQDMIDQYCVMCHSESLKTTSIM
jgi:cytochrome c5